MHCHNCSKWIAGTYFCWHLYFFYRQITCHLVCKFHQQQSFCFVLRLSRMLISNDHVCLIMSAIIEMRSSKCAFDFKHFPLIHSSIETPIQFDIHIIEGYMMKMDFILSSKCEKNPLINYLFNVLFLFQVNLTLSTHTNAYFIHIIRLYSIIYHFVAFLFETHEFELSWHVCNQIKWNTCIATKFIQKLLSRSEV